MNISSLRSWWTGVVHDARLKINMDEHHGTDTLVRQLGLFSVILFTITQAVGAGILTTPGIIARDYAGPHAWMSFLWAGLICAPPALCLARMARLTDRSGSTGSYACIVLGQFVGLLMFVDVMLECMGGTAAVAVSQADHIKILLRVAFDWHLPDVVTKTPDAIAWLPLLGSIVGCSAGWIFGRRGLNILTADKPVLPRWASALNLPAHFVGPVTFMVGAALGVVGLMSTWVFFTTLPSVNFLSVAIIGGITVVLLRGIKETAFLTNVFTILKLVVLTVIVYLLAQHYDPANLALPMTAGQKGTLAGASVAFFAFVGLDLATMTAAETKNAKRNVPLGMIIGLICVTALYVLAAYFYNAAVPYNLVTKGEEAAPLAKALEVLGYKSALIWVALGSTLALISVLLASAYSTTRLIFNMAQHKMLPAAFEKVSARHVPVLATLVVGGFVALLTGLLAVGELMHLTNIGTMTAFITISLTVLVKTVRETAWSTTSGKLMGAFWIGVAILGVVGPARLLMELPWEAFARLFFVWGSVTLLFVFYSRHHSLARKQAADEEKKS